MKTCPLADSDLSLITDERLVASASNRRLPTRSPSFSMNAIAPLTAISDSSPASHVGAWLAMLIFAIPTMVMGADISAM